MVRDAVKSVGIANPLLRARERPTSGAKRRDPRRDSLAPPAAADRRVDSPLPGKPQLPGFGRRLRRLVASLGGLIIFFIIYIIK